VIGTFTKENKFTLSIDDSHPSDPEQMIEHKKKMASMIIVEPYILIPTT
jgi:flagellar assembly factor FliW